MIEVNECVHRHCVHSTLSMAFSEEVDGWRLWWSYCMVCGRRTAPCLTWGEAVARAERGWWAEEE